MNPKTWLVTGASSGLGAALTAEILKTGDHVIATFRKKDGAEAFTSSSKGKGLGIVLDLNKESSIQPAIEEAIQKFGAIDVLVNNAGYGTIGAIEEFSMEEIRDQMETNYFGMVNLTKVLLPKMRANGGGYILQISSAAGVKATGGFGVYNASKFALEGFSEALAQEVRPFGIKVVIVEPGPFRTKFASGSIKLASHKMDEYKTTPVAQMYHYISRIDGRQEGDPEKGARAMIEYVRSGKETLRLPLGNHALEAIRAKLLAVEKDLKENEVIARSVMFER